MLEKMASDISQCIVTNLEVFPIVQQGSLKTYQIGQQAETMSNHAHYELSYIRTGNMEFILDGERVSLKQGETLLIRPNVNHTFSAVEDLAEIVVVYFMLLSSRDQNDPPVTLENFINFLVNPIQDEADEKPYYIISNQKSQSLSLTIEQIFLEKEHKEYASDLILELLSVQLTVFLYRFMIEQWKKSMQFRKGDVRELINIAETYLQENYQRNITIADVANYVFLSQGYFTRAFTKIVGEGPKTYLNKIRMNKACELLTNSDLKISNISMKTGFSSAQRFSINFRNQMNMTPSEYREQSRKKKEETE